MPKFFHDVLFQACFTQSKIGILSKCQIDGEDFVNFCGLLRKYELYQLLLQKIGDPLLPTEIYF